MSVPPDIASPTHDAPCAGVCNGLLQAAHRALALAVWALAGMVFLRAWGRDLSIEVYLPLILFGLSASATLVALCVHLLWGERGEVRGEARHLVVVGVVFSAIALALFLARLLLPKVFA